MVLVYVVFCGFVYAAQYLMHSLYDTSKPKAFYMLSGTSFVEDRWEARPKLVFPVPNFLDVLL